MCVCALWQWRWSEHLVDDVRAVPDEVDLDSVVESQLRQQLRRAPDSCGHLCKNELEGCARRHTAGARVAGTLGVMTKYCGTSFLLAARTICSNILRSARAAQHE